MDGWMSSADWVIIIPLVVWVVYNAARPIKDYYVIQRLYFDRIYEAPWRGKRSAAHYHGFIDYAAAKAFFDKHETEYMSILDTGAQEAEHKLFMVSARSKTAAISALVANKASRKELLHSTPYEDILVRRSNWKLYMKTKFEPASED